MAKELQKLEFEYTAENPRDIDFEQAHFGVVGSGDMEVIMQKKSQGGKATFTVVTPVTGFNEVWRLVLSRFVNEYDVGNINFEINDNNSTPAVVSLRLRQALSQLVKTNQ